MGIEKQEVELTEAGPTNHINCLELMAVFFGLKAFCSRMKSAHIYIYLVSTTTVNYAFYRVQLC